MATPPRLIDQCLTCPRCLQLRQNGPCWHIIHPNIDANALLLHRMRYLDVRAGRKAIRLQSQPLGVTWAPPVCDASHPISSNPSCPFLFSSMSLPIGNFPMFSHQPSSPVALVDQAASNEYYLRFLALINPMRLTALGVCKMLKWECEPFMIVFLKLCPTGFMDVDHSITRPLDYVSALLANRTYLGQVST